MDIVNYTNKVFDNPQIVNTLKRRDRSGFQVGGAYVYGQDMEEWNEAFFRIAKVSGIDLNKYSMELAVLSWIHPLAHCDTRYMKDANYELKKYDNEVLNQLNNDFFRKGIVDTTTAKYA